MSNKVNLVRTKFVTKFGEESYGYRIYDDYGAAYDNLLTKEQFDNFSDINLLAYAVDNPSDVSEAMLDHCFELEKSIYIDGELYEYEQIKDILLP